MPTLRGFSVDPLLCNPSDLHPSSITTENQHALPADQGVYTSIPTTTTMAQSPDTQGASIERAKIVLSAEAPQYLNTSSQPSTIGKSPACRTMDLILVCHIPGSQLPNALPQPPPSSPLFTEPPNPPVATPAAQPTTDDRLTAVQNALAVLSTHAPGLLNVSLQAVATRTSASEPGAGGEMDDDDDRSSSPPPPAYGEI